MRRRSGKVRRLGDKGTPRQTQNLAPDIEYAPWSLVGGTKVWQPEEILEQVMDRVAGEDNWLAKDRVLTGALELLDVENLEVTGPGDAAIAQVLAAVGGVVSVYVGANGKAVLFNRLSDKERGLVGAPARTGVGGITLLKDTPERVPLITDAAVWTVADRRMERPSSVRVLFERAIELRLDFKDEAPVAASSTTRGAIETGPEPALLENVLQIPEDLSEDSGLVNTAWVTVQTYLDFLEGKTLSGLPDLTLEGLNEMWLSPALQHYADPTVDPSGLWARRIAPFRQHYRRTFRLKRPWIDRINNMVASRVAIQDQESHARAQSPVFQDYSEWVTWRHGSGPRNVNDGPDVDKIVQNRFAGAGEALPGGGFKIVGTPLPLSPAPAVLRIIDADQGLVQVGFVFDYVGEAVRYTRSAIKGLNTPSESVADQNPLLQWGELRDNFELSTIVTVAPASPNDNRRLHAELVTHEAASAILPGGALAAAEEVANGPIYEVKVSKLPARFGWDDSKAPEVYKAFAIGTGDDDDPEGEEGAQDLLGVPINLDELQVYAKAVAASVYSGFRDRVVGGLTTGLVPGMEPEGTAQVVTHAATMGPNGGALTTVDLPEDVEKRDPMSLLPPDLRRLVDRFVDL